MQGESCDLNRRTLCTLTFPRRSIFFIQAIISLDFTSLHFIDFCISFVSLHLMSCHSIHFFQHFISFYLPAWFISFHSFQHAKIAIAPTPSLNFPPFKTHQIPWPGYCCQPPNHHVVHLQVTVVQVRTYRKAYLAA